MYRKVTRMGPRHHRTAQRRGYLQGRFTFDYMCLGWVYALSFSNCISLIKITICHQTTCIAVRVLTAQLTRSTRTTRRKLFKRKQAHGWGQLSAKKLCPVLPRVLELSKRANHSITIYMCSTRHTAVAIGAKRGAIPNRTTRF